MGKLTSRTSWMYSSHARKMWSFKLAYLLTNFGGNAVYYAWSGAAEIVNLESHVLVFEAPQHDIVDPVRQSLQLIRRHNLAQPEKTLFLELLLRVSEAHSRHPPTAGMSAALTLTRAQTAGAEYTHLADQPTDPPGIPEIQCSEVENSIILPSHRLEKDCDDTT